MGPQAEKKLHILTEALLARWKESPRPFRLCGYLGTFANYIKTDDDYRFSLFVGQDPMHITPVRQLIHESIARRAKKREASAVEMIQPRSPRNLNRCSSEAESLHLLDLPLEIQYMIHDCLGFEDIESLLHATGWEVSRGYWRSRLPKNIIFELDQINPQVELDWCFYCPQVEPLVTGNPQLRNRGRILQILGETKELFLYLVSQEEIMGKP